MSGLAKNRNFAIHNKHRSPQSKNESKIFTASTKLRSAGEGARKLNQRRFAGCAAVNSARLYHCGNKGPMPERLAVF